MSEKVNVEQLEAEIAALAEQEADMCQQVLSENPDDADTQANAYYHPQVRAISDRLRGKIAEWHAALPDDHPEFKQRALAPRYVRDQADAELRAAFDRLHAGGEIEKSAHKELHAAIDRTARLAVQHRAALTGQKET